MAALTAAPPSAPAKEVDGQPWSCIDFISDLHLQQSEVATFQAWSHYLRDVQADALFILGDLFEVWVGDDLLDHPAGEFERDCLHLIRQTSLRLPVYWMVGNRDFLFGAKALAASGMQALSDPCVLDTRDGSGLLSHGDELCLADTDYQVFRKQVRSTAWQAAFLAQPLDVRTEMARQLRAQSEARKNLSHTLVDVDLAATQAWLDESQTTWMVHGHTHQPACHDLEQGKQRWVLSDWDGQASPPRLQALRWQAERGFHRIDLHTV